jgi:hypothetical protein
MTRSDLRVPTIPLAVELRCVDGRRFAGEVYLPAQSLRQDSPMRAYEWANGPQRFVPFRAHEGACRTVFNKTQLAVMTVSADANHAEHEPADCPVYHVIVEIGDLRLDGQIVVDLPPAQQRLVDLLNGGDTFVTLRDGDRHHLVNKRHVTRVIELPEP